MRSFILLCLTAVAVAAPQGYNYSPSAAASGVINSGYVGPSVGSFSSAPTVGASFSSSGSSAGGFYQGSAGGYASSHGHQQNVEPIVTKRFFIHSAPEDHDEDYKERHITVGVPKKNYNVVFIKAPSKSSKRTTLKISPAVNEEKTVVYVLTKKGDAHDVQTEVLEQPQVQTKPEVFFIKYNTNEEAAHAQEQIQSQYDALGGSSQVTDEGFAPVSSVIGSLGQNNAAGVGAGHSISQGASHGAVSTASLSGNRGSANNAYLPPAYHK